jgi:opacity protein-like surface antigen
MKKSISTIAFLVLSSNMLIAGGDFMEPVEPCVSIPKKEIVILDENVKYSGFYTGAGANYMRMSEATTSTGYGMTINAGYYFNQYIGVEARYMTTLSDLDVESARPIVSTSDTLSNVGLYVKPMYSLTTGFAFYGLAGYGQAMYDKNGEEYSENGFQWGLGAKYELTGGLGLYVDYLDIFNDDDFDSLKVKDVKMSATTVGATYTF